MNDRAVSHRLRESLQVFLIVGGLLSTWPAVAAREAVPPPGLEFPRLLGTPAVVRWQARTLDPDTRFRLYRGAVGGPLGLIAVVNAKEGVGWYEVRDEAEKGFTQVYELRVVSSDGQERLLRRVSCRRFEAGSPAKPAGGASRSLEAGLRAVPRRPGPSDVRSAFLLGTPDPVFLFRPEPLFPPPREASGPNT